MRSTTRLTRFLQGAATPPLRRFEVLCAVSSLFLSACGGGGTEPTKPPVRVASSVAAVGWQGVTGTAGQPSSVVPAIVVKDQDGAALAGVNVAFAVTAGGGTVGTASATTNASGIASAGSWTFGSAAGSQNVRATVASLPPVDFGATVNAGAPANVLAHEGAAQSAPVGSAVTVVPAARVTDQYGNPVSGVAVTFAVTAGGGSVSGPSLTTDANGIARPTGWTLGTQLGTNTLTATVNGIATPAVFTATATPGTPASLLIETGNGQTGVVGAPVPVAPRVRLEDAYHNPVSGATITFTITGGGGSAAGPTPVTDAQGTAAVGSWTLGTVAGANSMRASYGNGSLTADFTATGTAGPATALVTDAGNGQTGVVGAQVAVAPRVRVEDAYHNPVAGLTIAFSVTGGGGSATGVSAVTDAQGTAAVGSWTLGTQIGTNTLTATASGMATPAVFTATATAGPPSALIIEAGNGQTGVVGAPVAVAPRVRLEDAYHNPVVGATVVFTVTGGGGSVAGASVVTNGQGSAAVGSWTLGTVAGANSLRASYGSNSLTTDFTATAHPDVPASITLSDGPTGTVPVGTVVTPSAAVRVSDRFSNAIASVQVTFTPGINNGTIAQSTSTTGSDGIAHAASWTLGPFAGVQSLNASASGLSLRIDVNAVAGPPAYMFLERGGDQLARVNTTLSIAPAVSVYDQYFNPVIGQLVTFTTEAGSGTLTGTTPLTNSQGIAEVGSWTLGPTEGFQRIDASVPGISGSIAARAVPVSSFNIQLRYLTPATTTQQQAFAAAVDRWTKVIIGDIPDVPVSLPANTCGVNDPAINETIDDLVIYVLLDSIDGPGAILGSSYPCAWRSGSLQAALGVMHFDTADLAQMEASGQLRDLILHEMGHVLGIGSQWPSFGYVTGAGTSDPYYTGPNGRDGWTLVNGNAYPGNPVPVENVGGPGTADSHWRNSVLGTELMTGYAEQGQPLPLSLVTVGGIADLGYGITVYGYDVYQYGTGLFRAAPGTLRQLNEAPPPKPPIELDASGRPVVGRAGARVPPSFGASDRIRRALPSLAPSPRDLKKRPTSRARK